MASIAVALQGFLDYTVDLYPVLYFPVQPSQRRHPYELSVSIFTYSGVLFFGRDLPRSAPAPLPASIYGLLLLLAALRFGIVKLEQVKEVGLFLTGIFPLLFVPAAAGVMELWAEMGEMLLPIVIAIIPVTVLVLVSAGRTTQALTSRRAAKKEAEHD